ncbi:MAG: hypothetical protein NC417_05125 [Candidatus Gastranaerophilales bacterium]|nr:hypothetical protein [Candidatus Gastranaerophilales bacterium]
MKHQTNEGYLFALEFLSDIQNGIIAKECMTNHSENFTGGMEDLHRERFNVYLSSCGCFLMDNRIRKSEEAYHG